MADSKETTVKPEDREENESRIWELIGSLELERARLATILDNLPVGVWLADRNGKITDTNREADRIWAGDAPHSAKAEEYSNYVAWFVDSGKRLETEDYPMTKVMRTGKPATPVELRIRRFDGTEGFIIISAVPIKNKFGSFSGVALINMDITDQKLMEKALTESEEKYHGLFNSMTEYLQVIELVRDREGMPRDYIIIDVNPAWEQLTGFKRENIVGHLGKDLFGVVEDSWLEAFDKVIRTGEPIRFESYGAALDKYYAISAWRIGENQCAFTASDITDAKRAQIRVEGYARSLELINSDLQQFAYVASHDLQEPLRMVNNFVELLERMLPNDIDPMAKEYIGFVKEGALRMKRLIDDILQYARIESAGQHFVEVDMNLAADRALKNLSKSKEESGAEIRLAMLPTIKADETQMVQLFQNLIGNAIKFRGDYKPVIEIGASTDSYGATFFVKDNGIGLDMQYANFIFAPFKRLNSSSQYPGSGIGLAIAKRIVERHGGRIWVDSTVGTGSTFFFTIPNGKKIEP